VGEKRGRDGLGGGGAGSAGGSPSPWGRGVGGGGLGLSMLQEPPHPPRFARRPLPSGERCPRGNAVPYTPAERPRLKKRSFWSSVAVSRFDLMLPTISSAFFTAGRAAIASNQRARFGLCSHLTPCAS